MESERALDSRMTHILIGEPVSTSPEYALDTSYEQAENPNRT